MELSALFPKFGLGWSGEEKPLLGMPAVAPRRHAALKDRCECATVFRLSSTKLGRTRARVTEEQILGGHLAKVFSWH